MILWVWGEPIWEVLPLPVMLALATVVCDLSGLQGQTQLTVWPAADTRPLAHNDKHL